MVDVVVSNVFSALVLGQLCFEVLYFLQSLHPLHVSIIGFLPQLSDLHLYIKLISVHLCFHLLDLFA